MNVLIGTIALCVISGCASSRKTMVDSNVESRATESRITDKRDSVVVAERDSVTITRTITITENERGDTIRMSMVTDRDRLRSMSDVRSQKEEMRVVRDTVYVEKRDSVAELRNHGGSESRKYGGTESSGGNPVAQVLKWVFWIVVAVTVLMIVINVFKFFR